MNYLNSETRAKEFLIKNQFIIIANNVRWKKSEIDILCEKNNTIYAIEVKYRSNLSYFQITNNQKLKIEEFMCANFQGQQWELIIILVNKNSVSFQPLY